MTWTATAGRTTSATDAGNRTDVIVSNGVKTVTLSEVPNDGTAGSLEANTRAAIIARNAQGQRDVVTPGTILDLTTPPSVPPAEPAPGFASWSALWATYLRLQSLAARDVPSVTAQRVSDAKAAHEAAYQSAFEAFLL